MNPIEQVWAWLKGKIACKIFDAVADLKECVNDIIDNTDSAVFKSIVHRDFIFDSIKWLEYKAICL